MIQVTENLISALTTAYNTQNLPGEYRVRGTIRCAKRGCGKERNSLVCPECGYPSCYVSVYFKGKHWSFWRDKDGNPLVDYRRASDMLASITLDINNGKFNPLDWSPSKIKERKFENRINTWLEQKKEEAKANELSFETIKNYKGYVKNYFLPFFQGWDVREIRFEQVQEFTDSLRFRVQKIKTRRNILNALHSFFSWLRRKGTLTGIPEWPVIKGNDAEMRKALDYEAQQYGLNNIPETHRDVIEFGFETGLRPGELSALQVGDLDISSRRVLIQRTWSGPHLRETTKGGSKKYIPLSKRAYELALKHSQDKMPSVFLFINADTDRCYKPKKLNELWRKYSNTETTHYCGGRHSFCTQIIQTEGANIFDAQELMRHECITSTRKYYHATTQRLEDIVNKRGKIVEIPKEQKQAKRQQNE